MQAPSAVGGRQKESDSEETIHGTFSIVAIDPSGKSTAQPVDLSEWTINAWVENHNGDRSGLYGKRAGKGDANGKFTIDGVPKGSYWLEYGCSRCSPALQPEFDEINTRRPALGHYLAVPRANLKLAPRGVMLNFNVTDIPCFPAESAIRWDEFEWWVPNALARQAVGRANQISFLNPCENPGVFSGSARWDGPLMGAESVDSGYLLGYAYAAGPNADTEIWHEEFVAAAYGPEPLTTPGGRSLDITGAAITPSAVNPNVPYSSFVALEKGSWSATSCTALPQWLGEQYGFLFPAPEEFYYRILYQQGVPTESIGCGSRTVAISNPFVPTSAPLAYYFEDSALNRNWAATTGNDLAPRVGPPTAPQVDGQDFFAHGGSLTKATPTLSWSAPTVGQTNLYLVYLARPQGAVLFTTRNTRVMMPPGLLSPGDSYSFSIVAVYDAAGCAGNGDTRLCEMSLEQGGAQLFSGVLQVTLPNGAPARAAPLSNEDDAVFGGNIAQQLHRNRERQENRKAHFDQLESAN